MMIIVTLEPFKSINIKKTYIFIYLDSRSIGLLIQLALLCVLPNFGEKVLILCLLAINIADYSQIPWAIYQHPHW